MVYLVKVSRNMAMIFTDMLMMLCLFFILNHKFPTLVLEYPCPAHLSVFADPNTPTSSQEKLLISQIINCSESQVHQFWFAGSAQDQTDINGGKFL